MAGFNLDEQMRFTAAGGKFEMGDFSSTADTNSPEVPTSLVRVRGGLLISGNGNGATSKTGRVSGDATNGYVDFTLQGDGTAGPYSYVIWGY